MGNDLYRLIQEPGKHLAESHNTRGAYRGVYLDDETNKPCGAGEFVKVEEDEYENKKCDPKVRKLDGSVSTYAGLIAIGIGIGAVATMVYPYVKEWVGETAVPGIKKFWNRILKKEEIAEEIIEKNITVDIMDLATAKEFSCNVDEVLDEYKENMSSEEAQKHLLNIMCCAMFTASEIRKLSNTVIRDASLDEEQRLAWKMAMEKLVTQNVIDNINQILERNVLTLEYEEIEQLSLLIGDSLILDGKFVPIKIEEIREILNIEI